MQTMLTHENMQDVLDEVSAEIEREEEMRAQHANQKKQVCTLTRVHDLCSICSLMVTLS